MSIVLSSHFVRQEKELESEGALLFKQLHMALINPEIDKFEFYEELSASTLQPHMEHNSNIQFEFYNNFYTALLQDLQTPTIENVEMLSTMKYLESMEFAGFKPVFRADPAFFGMDNLLLVDMEPVFNVWIESLDDNLKRTLAFRTSVSLAGEFYFHEVDLSFIREQLANVDEPIHTGKKRTEVKASANTVATKKKKRAKV